MTCKPLLPFILTLALLISACGAEGGNFERTATPELLTPTMPATATPEPTQTRLPPTSIPTVPPVEGITTTQVNIRAEPSTNSAVLGIIPPSMKVLIQGKDGSG
ncbi:MAG: SH3 domain-containing protein, partial [Chloroflexota bacterium]